jgi:dTDP-4-dehydrorhamnose reductase
MENRKTPISSSIKILVTGCTGYVGRLLYDYLEKDHEVYGASIDCEQYNRNYRCDLRDEKRVKDLSKAIRPDVIIHAAGLKDIGICERNSNEAFSINSLTTENIAKVFGMKARIIYISTDYVFEGSKGDYTANDVPKPLTIYGKSKLSGEKAGLSSAPDNFIVLRTSALYDSNAKFIKFLDHYLSKGESVNCYTDVIYSPTFFGDFTTIVKKIIQNKINQQIYHVSGDKISRYEFALLFAEAYGYNTELIKPVPRPSNEIYLFPDLSLNNEMTRSIFGYYPTAHKTALGMLARQRKLG